MFKISISAGVALSCAIPTSAARFQACCGLIRTTSFEQLSIAMRSKSYIKGNLHSYLSLALAVACLAPDASAKQPMLRGRVGLARDWALSVSLIDNGEAQTTSASTGDRPLVLRHIGFCAHGEQNLKTGTAVVKIDEEVVEHLTLSYAGERCTLVKPVSLHLSPAQGFLACGDGTTVPASLWVER